MLNANDGLTSTDAVHEALALAGATGEHWSDAILHRICGDMRPRVARACGAWPITLGAVF